MGEHKKQVNVRGLSPLGLETPVEGPQLGGRVTTLSTGYTGKTCQSTVLIPKLFFCLLYSPPYPCFFLRIPLSHLKRNSQRTKLLLVERPVTTSPAEGVGLGVSFTTVSQELSVAIPTAERAHGYSQGGSTLLTVGSDQVKSEDLPSAYILCD